MGEAEQQQYAISIDDIRAAAERIRGLVHQTPVLQSTTINRTAGRCLFFKAEVFQKIGAFKARGAANAVQSLSDEECAHGVVAHSSGNHAQALAWAAGQRGIPSYLVVPSTTPACKVDAIRDYNPQGKLLFCEPTLQARESLCQEVIASTQATFIHPYNNPLVMAGQATIALEFYNQVPNLDAVVIPVSGGGMLSGITIAWKALNPSIRIIAAEPCGRNNSADVYQCKQAQLLLRDLPKTETIADGLQANLGSLTWPIVRDLVDAVVTVTEEEIVNAMKLCFERLKVVVEPSGAVGLAAVLSEGFEEVAGGVQRVGVVLCGGNADLEGRGLWKAYLEDG